MNIRFIILISPILVYENNKIVFKFINKINLILRWVDNVFGITWKEIRSIFKTDLLYDLLILETPRTEEKLLVQRILNYMVFREKSVMLHNLSYIKSYTKDFDNFYKLNSIGNVDESLEVRKVKYLDVQISSKPIIDERKKS